MFLVNLFSFLESYLYLSFLIPTQHVNSVTSLLMSTQERKMMEGMMMTLMMVGLIMEIRRHVYLLFVFIVLRKRKRARIGRRTIASYNTKEHVT